MPPIAAQKDEMDRLFALVSPSVITVVRNKNKKFVNFGAGFIMYCDDKKIYIHVHPSIIKSDEDLEIRFSNNTYEQAHVFLPGDSKYAHAVLVVDVLTTHSWRQVRFCEEPIGRTELFTVAAVERNQAPGLMTGKVITPDCTTFTEDHCYVPGSGDLFLMSCPAGGVWERNLTGNAARIVGAAVFNMSGSVIGTIQSIDSSGFDIKFAAKVGSFLTALEQSLQTLDTKVLLSRSQKVSEKESFSAGDGTSHQADTPSGSGSKKSHRSPSVRKTLGNIVTGDELEAQVATMMCARGVSTICSNRKEFFATSNGGDSHLANPYEEEFVSSSDSGQGVWSILSDQLASNWAESLVSITSFDEGGSIHYACTGIVIHHTKTTANLLASLSLFRSSDDDRELNEKLTTKVRLPNNHIVNGVLLSHDLKHNVAVVRAWPKGGGLRAVCLDHPQQLEPPSLAVAVQRCFSSGKLKSTAVMLAGDPMGAYHEEAVAGGLLIDFHGNFVGLNFYDKEGTAFIPRSTILELVAGFQKTYKEKSVRPQKKLADHSKTVLWWEVKRIQNVQMKGRAINMPARSPSHMPCLQGSSRMEMKQSGCHYCDSEGQSALRDRFNKFFYCHPRWPATGDSVSKEAAWNRIKSRGYPFPVFDDPGMRLLCNFEEEFGEDIWSKLTKEVALDMSQSVVALASFSGDKRFFACTGVFIGCNEFTTRVLTSASLVRNSDDEAKVADDLKIEVCLPDNQHTTGTLQHYNLHYNIAVISIMGSCSTRTAQIYDQLETEPHGEVVAVGRIYESGKLIATGGILIDKPSKLDCKELMMSTCTITKAGIGGPLIDCDGNFIGMDFYSSEETPYLPRNIIREVLSNFDAKPIATDFVNDHNPNRWPVPKPYWCYPSWHLYKDEYRGKRPNVIDLRPQPM